MNVCVVIPTYNERENITPLIAAVMRTGIPDLHIVVVDDASPDGTGNVVESLRPTFPTLHVLHRNGKRGLGHAYRDGFQYALDHGAQWILQMDADGSHPSDRIPDLLRAAMAGADLVVGSRYVAGGTVENWNLPRRWISRFGNWYARTVLGVPVRDLTAGFKCFRRAVLEQTDVAASDATGYHFQIEMTYRAIQKGFRVRELPITFSERREGRSKFHLGIILESTLGVWKLKRGRGMGDGGQGPKDKGGFQVPGDK